MGLFKTSGRSLLPDLRCVVEHSIFLFVRDGELTPDKRVDLCVLVVADASAQVRIYADDRMPAAMLCWLESVVSARARGEVLGGSWDMQGLTFIRGDGGESIGSLIGPSVLAAGFSYEACKRCVASMDRWDLPVR